MFFYHSFTLSINIEVSYTFFLISQDAEPAVSQKSGVSLALDEPPNKKSRTETEKPAKEKKLSETEADVDTSKDKDAVITLSPRSPAGEPPEPEEIIKALMVIFCVSIMTLTKRNSSRIWKIQRRVMLL